MQFTNETKLQHLPTSKLGFYHSSGGIIHVLFEDDAVYVAKFRDSGDYISHKEYTGINAFRKARRKFIKRILKDLK